MARDVVFFIAMLSTALALGGALAHAFELPNKIGLSRDEYFIVQKAYRGWNQLAYLLIVELVSMTALAVMLRGQPWVLYPVIAAILFLLAAQGIFWVYTFPANSVTDNWTIVPDEWRALRRQWEYSHAAGALLQVLAMSSLIVAALAQARRSA